MSTESKLLKTFRKYKKWVGITTCTLLLLTLAGETSISARIFETSNDIHPGSVLSDKTNWLYYLPLISNAGCESNSFGTMLLGNETLNVKNPADVMIYANDWLGMKGMVSAGAPSEYVRDQWFGRLPGWKRSIIRGTYDQLDTIHLAALTFNMADMYECIGYGPESVHQAGSEALEPLVWVPMAKDLADATGKCLIYGPAVLDYEKMATEFGVTEPDDEKLSELISSVSPYVDIWVVQLAKYQRWTDAGFDNMKNPFSVEDFSQWAAWWVAQIENGNPETEVWAQLGIGVFDPITKKCLEPQPPEYILKYRQILMSAGFEGVFVMPSQACQNSTDPEDQENYLKTLEVLQKAIELACGK